MGGDFKRGQRAAYEKMMGYVQMMISARLEWAQSDEGRRTLGPGSPTVPGLQDLYAMRDRIEWLADKNEQN